MRNSTGTEMANLRRLQFIIALVIGSVAVSQKIAGIVGSDGDIINFDLASSSKSTREIFTTYKTFSRKGKGRGFLTNPYGIVYCEHLIFVVDSENHRVQAFRENGTFVYKIGNGRGYAVGEQFRYPHGISCYNGHLYVADNENSRVQIFHANNGSFINMFARRPDCLYAELGFPHGAVVCDDIVAILDTYNHRLQMLSLDASHTRRVGSKGEKPEFFSYPEAITCYNHQLFVADTHNNRIQSFTSGGDFVRVYDLISNLPNAVAACNGRLFVSDSENHRVSEYSIATGEFIFSMGSEGQGNYQFNKIGGLFCDDGVLFVTDFWNNRFHIIPAKEILTREREEGFVMDPLTGKNLAKNRYHTSGEYDDEEDDEEEEEE
jgi:outer membrane protein assembly factor BamB